MLRQVASLVGLIYALAACASRVSIPETTPSSPRSIPAGITAPSIQSGGPWSLTLSTAQQTHTYQSTTYAIIHEPSTPRTRTDTVKLATQFALSLSQLLDEVTISGSINSIIITLNSTSPLENSNLKLPIKFTGKVTNSELTLDLPDNQVECTSVAHSLLGELHPVIAIHPSLLFAISTWKDSISTTTCSGAGIPTILKTNRSYRVIGEVKYAAVQALLIERAESVSFTGAGTQGPHRVYATGVGTGISNIYLDTNTGVVIAVETTQKTAVTITASGQTHRFLQETTQKIHLVSLVN